MQTRNEHLLAAIRASLAAAHGCRLAGVVLFGSEARGTSKDDSDIDVLVVLEGPVRYLKDLETSIHAVYPLSLELGRPISPIPVDVREYEEGEFPLYARAKLEGITV